MARVILIFGLSLLFCGKAAADSGKSKDPAPNKIYICTAAGAVWNQSRPCGESTPERAEIFKRISTSRSNPSRDELAIKLQEQVYTANLGQLWNYPERYAGHEVEVSEVLLSGNVQRSQDPKIPEGQRTVASVFDRFGRSLAILVNDGAGHRLVGDLSPNKRYPLSKLRLRVMRTVDGYLPELVGLELSGDKPQYLKVALPEHADPLIPLAPELRVQNEFANGTLEQAQHGSQHDSQSATVAPYEEEPPSLESKEESFPSQSSDLPEESRKKIKKLTGAYQKFGSIFEGGSTASSEEADDF